MKAGLANTKVFLGFVRDVTITAHGSGALHQFDAPKFRVMSNKIFMGQKTYQ